MKRLLGRILPIALTAALLAAPVQPASAQPPDEGAAVLRLDPSVRAGGMGRASSAVFWGGDPNDWANPSLIAYHRGLRFEHGKTKLIPDLADDVFFLTDRLTLAVAGLGLGLGGDLDPLGRRKLDYGPSVEQGNDIGTFHSYEEVSSWTFGVRAVETLESLLRLVGGPDVGLSRFADVAWGHSEKETVVDLAPGPFDPGDLGRAEVFTKDQGIHIRATPYNSIDHPGILPGLDPLFESLGGFRVDAAYARSTLNRRGASYQFVPGSDDVYRVFESRRVGWAFRAAVGLPDAIRARLESRRFPFLPAAFTPLVSLGVAWDRTERDGDEDIEESGAELALGNVLFLRLGRVKDPNARVDGDTWGIGVGIPIGDFAGARYDHAKVPQSEGLDPVHRNSITLFVDPLALARHLRSRVARR